MKKNIKAEPIVTAAVLVTIVSALLQLLVAFGLQVSDEQTEAILNIVTVAGPLLLAVPFIRRAVTANANVVEREENGVVLAGDANELETGTYVRDAGDLGGLSDPLEA